MWGSRVLALLLCLLGASQGMELRGSSAGGLEWSKLVKVHVTF